MTMQATTAGSVAMVTDMVRVTYCGESRVVPAVAWKTAADELVAKHGTLPGVWPMVERHDGATAPTEPPPAAPAVVVVGSARPAAPPAAKYLAPGVSATGKARSEADKAAAEASGFAPAETLYERGREVVSLGVDNARKSRMKYDALPLAREAAASVIGKVESEHRRDHVVAVEDLAMNQDGTLRIPGVGDLPMTPDALIGMANRLGFGGGAYLVKSWPALRSANVNAWIERIALGIEADREERRAKGKAAKRERTLMLGIRDGEKGPQVYRAVSEHYGDYSVDKIGEALSLAAPADARGAVRYDGTRARFEVLFHSNIRPEEYVCGEFFKAGVIVHTDDTGGGAIGGDACVWQNLCLNLIIINAARQRVFAVPHTGTVAEMAEAFRKGFGAALGKLDHFRKAWGYAVRDDVAEAARKSEFDATGMTLDELVAATMNGIVERELVPVRGRRDVVVLKLLEMWKKDDSAAAGPTRAAIVNAFTRYAHEVNEDPWQEAEIERAAGSLLFGRRGAEKPAPLPFLPFEPDEKK